ncbi:MAG: hypothetical protein ACYDAJ_09850 [Nitrosotalea sp.]
MAMSTGGKIMTISNKHVISRPLMRSKLMPRTYSMNFLKEILQNRSIFMLKLFLAPSYGCKEGSNPVFNKRF